MTSTWAGMVGRAIDEIPDDARAVDAPPRRMQSDEVFQLLAAAVSTSTILG